VDVSHDQAVVDGNLDEAVKEFWHLTENGHSRRRAMTQAAQTFGLPVRAVYAAVEAAKKSGK
jgi:hypothetical protein